MRRPLFSVIIVACVLSAQGALADNQPPPKPPNPFPMGAMTFRAQIDQMVDAMRGACSRSPQCPKEYVESGITQMKFRTLEACRDGVVTESEAKWVYSAKPTVPVPRPAPRPGPPDPDEDD